MAPAWSLWPLVIFATGATVIASQAVISGVFSVTTQAVSLGLLPRLRVEHSSADVAGQIYVPTMNWILMVAALALVRGVRQFRGVGRSIRPGGFRRHDHRDPADLEPHQVADGQGQPCAAHRIVVAVHRRHRVPARQSDQARGRRLAAAGIRPDYFLADADLAKRARLADGAVAARTEAGARFHRGLEVGSAGARGGHVDFPGSEGIGNTARLAQQHQVQSRHARTGRAA